MMFCYRFVRLIETHADTLAAGLEKKVMFSPCVSSFQTIPVHEVRERVYEIYRHLGDWLLGKNHRILSSAIERSVHGGHGRKYRWLK